MSAGIKKVWFQNGNDSHTIGIVVEATESKETGTEWSKDRQERSEMSASEWGSMNHGDEYFLYDSHHILDDAQAYLLSIQFRSVCRHWVIDLLRIIGVRVTFAEDDWKYENEEEHWREQGCPVGSRQCQKFGESRPTKRWLGNHVQKEVSWTGMHWQECIFFCLSRVSREG